MVPDQGSLGSWFINSIHWRWLLACDSTSSWRWTRGAGVWETHGWGHGARQCEFLVTVGLPQHWHTSGSLCRAVHVFTDSEKCFRGGGFAPEAQIVQRWTDVGSFLAGIYNYLFISSRGAQRSETASEWILFLSALLAFRF